MGCLHGMNVVSYSVCPHWDSILVCKIYLTVFKAKFWSLDERSPPRMMINRSRKEWCILNDHQNQEDECICILYFTLQHIITTYSQFVTATSRDVTSVKKSLDVSHASSPCSAFDQCLINNEYYHVFVLKINPIFLFFSSTWLWRHDGRLARTMCTVQLPVRVESVSGLGMGHDKVFRGRDSISTHVMIRNLLAVAYRWSAQLAF